MLQYLIVCYLVILSASIVDSQCPDFITFTGNSSNQFNVVYKINSVPTTPTLTINRNLTIFPSNNYTTLGFDICPNEAFSIHLTPIGFILDDIIVGVIQFGFVNNSINITDLSATVTINNFARNDCVLPGSSGFTFTFFRTQTGSNVANGITVTIEYSSDDFEGLNVVIFFRSQGETVYTPFIRNTTSEIETFFVYQGVQIEKIPPSQIPRLQINESRNCSTTSTVSTVGTVSSTVGTVSSTTSILSSFYYTAGLLFVTLLFYSF